MLLYVVAISLLLVWISLMVNEYNFLSNILGQEQADGCKLISHGILITLQDSSPTGTSDLISYIELKNELPPQPLNRCNSDCKT